MPPPTRPTDERRVGDVSLRMSHLAPWTRPWLAIASVMAAAVLLRAHRRRREQRGQQRGQPRSSRIAAPNLGMSLEDHVHLKDMDVLKFELSPAAQALLMTMQTALLEEPYAAFGRIDHTRAGERFNIVFPSSFGSDRRKPVTPAFQQFCESVYWPLANALLFGSSTMGDLRQHLTSYKINTLRISEDEFYYNQPIYHFHLDHKIGKHEPKDENQQRTMRMIFSVVPGATRETPDGDIVAVRNPAFDSTVYLTHQPPAGFHHNDGLHQYLSKRFPERGLVRNRQRPLYEVADAELYRAKPGEICLHHSHPGRPVHAETNPCPEGRGLHVLDWADVRNVVYRKQQQQEPPGRVSGPTLGSLPTPTPAGDVDGSGLTSAHAAPRQKPKAKAPRVDRVLPCSRIPMANILALMRALDGCCESSDAYRQRLRDVDRTAQALLGEAATFPGGQEALEKVCTRIAQELKRVSV